MIRAPVARLIWSNFPTAELDPAAEHYLYLTFDGLQEPLGASQITSYLLERKTGLRPIVVSLEKEMHANLDRVAEIGRQLRAAGVFWVAIDYGRPLAYVGRVGRGLVMLATIVRLCVHLRVRLIHARSYLPCLIALCAKGLTRVPVLFDIRGFWFDEKVDAGTWRPDSPLYRLGKAIEGFLYRHADAVITLTHRSRPIIRANFTQRATSITVIPTCVDLNAFRPRAGNEARPELRIGHLGNVAGWYDFTYFLRVCRALEAHWTLRITVINNGQHELVRTRAREHGFADDRIELVGLPFRDVPQHIANWDLTAFWIRPAYSKLASAPTRLAEFLACGVPCITASGVGDLGAIVRYHRVGVIVEQADIGLLAQPAGREAVTELMSAVTRARCRETAAQLFDVRIGAQQQAEIYAGLTMNHHLPCAV